MYGEIIPRPDLASDQYKELAEAINRWLTYAVQMEFDHWISLDALEDLHLGEPPRPLAIILADNSETTLSNLRKALGGAASERTVPFKVRIGTSPELVLASLRQYIPSDFVTDILLGGSSIFE